MEKIEICLGYDDLAAIRQIFQEYTDSLQVDLDFQHYDEELQNLEQKYGMPQGRIYAAYVEGALAGCMAFHAPAKYQWILSIIPNSFCHSALMSSVHSSARISLNTSRITTNMSSN